jgi:2-polyprenyl-6-methoxyphenol hydroxylase-like FAD-dependent oxidoreductase
MSGFYGTQAIVIGAGIGGLAAAAAIAEFFDTVIVLERDGLPATPSPRKGTPQSYHPHALLIGGQRALGELFPDFDKDLVRAGAVPFRLGLDMHEDRPGYDPFPRRDLGLVTLGLSRPLIEHTARTRLRQFPNVIFLDRCHVLNLVPADDGSVAGVRYQDSDGEEQLLDADLVIDASARPWLTLALLKETGRPQPQQTRIGIDMNYATGVFSIEQPPAWKLAVVTPDNRASRKIGVLYKIEGDRWMAAVGERHAPQPPGDVENFLGQMRELRTSTISDVLQRATPLGGIHRFTFLENCWRHYERLDDFPRGLLPIGDAICRFNPVHGQGMTVATMEACVLRQLLRTADDTKNALAALSAAFFVGVRPLIEGAWSMSAIPDFAHSSTRGERPANLQDILQFNTALLRAAAADADVHARMVRVRHFIDPPSGLHEPAIARRIQMEMAEAL